MDHGLSFVPRSQKHWGRGRPMGVDLSNPTECRLRKVVTIADRKLSSSRIATRSIFSTAGSFGQPFWESLVVA